MTLKDEKGMAFVRTFLVSLLAISALCLVLTKPAMAQSAQVIFDDQLENGWQNWSWATVNFANTSPTHTGNDSISVTDPSGYEALWLHPSADFADNAYGSITFWINPGTVGGQGLAVEGISGTNTVTGEVGLPVTPVAGQWTQETVMLASIGAANISNFAGIWIQNTTGSPEATYYIDDVSMATAVPDGNITVDVSQNKHAISPQIYGVAFGSTADVADMNLTLNRWGGNATTGYNWQIDASRHASDYYFESIGNDDGTIAKSADDFISQSIAGNTQPAMTLSLIGWAANLGPSRSILWSFSQAKYGAQTASDPYRPDAGNGVLSPSGPDVTGNDPNDANIPIDVSFEKGWVDHMISKFGTSANGGVKYYLMDNEPSIWFSTHRDVHPNGPTMDEILNGIIATGSMVKTEDPNALIQGPEEWGWGGYFYSGADQQWAPSHSYNYAAAPDRVAHNGMDYVPYLLQSLQNYQTAHGTRLLDILSLHMYPQGDTSGHYEFSSATDTATELLRNRSTRELWDTSYTSQSWIGAPVYLIPRMKTWVNTYYPGTKTGITEYNWGDESVDYNCATTQADILGIMGREGLDVATRWVSPATGSPMYYAMKIYRNYDGNRSTFGDTSVLDSTPNPDDVSSFAAVRSSDGALTITVVNKLLTASTPINLNIANFANTGVAHVWQLSSANPTIGQLADLTVASNAVAFTAPAQSITMLVIPQSMIQTVPTPVITPASGSYVNSVSMSVSDSLAGATIKYTSDGSDPATSAGARVYSAPVTFTRGANITVVAIKSGYSNSAEVKAAYTITSGATVPTPVIAPSAGTYVGSVGVTITDSLSGATIKYTTDGTNPATSGTAQTYSTGFTLTSSATVAAVAIKSGYANSAIATSAYTVTPIAPAPVISPNGATFTAPVPVTITDSLTGSTIKYTTDGTNPATSSTAQTYSAGFTLNASATVNAIATKSGYAASALSTQTYTINAGSVVPTPVITPGTGSYSKTVTETITESLAGVTLKYTSDGSDPATNVNARTTNGTIVITRSSTIRVVGIKTGYLNSAEPTATVTITP